MKRVILFAYLYCGYVQLRDLILSLIGRSRAVVLYYHRIGDPDVLTRSREQFRRDLLYLKDHYECIGLRDLCDRLRTNLPLRRKSVVVTFDDGYRDNFLEAAPLLKRARIPAAFFVATGFIGTDREFEHDLKAVRNSEQPSGLPARTFPKLSWEDLRSLEAQGFEVGSHTVSHANLARADEQTLKSELADSLKALNTNLGTCPRAFSFPWGKLADISDEAIGGIRSAGYYCSASAYGGVNRPGQDLFDVKRIDVGNGAFDSLAFRARIAGFDLDYLRLKLGPGLWPRPSQKPKVLRSAKLCLLFLSALAACLLQAGQAKANTIYVSTTGRDSNTGSLQQPLATPRRAVDVAAAGDTIYLRAGRYPATRILWLSKPGLTLASYPGETASIVGPIDDEKTLLSMIVINADSVSVIGLDIQGGSYYGVKIDVDKAKSTNGVIIRGCHIHDTGQDCVKTFNADNLLIEDCEIGPSGVHDPSNAEGIDSIGSVGVTIRRCYIHDSTTNGVYLKGGARDGVIESCRIENVKGYGGILLGQDTDIERMRDGTKYEAINCVARNNIIAHTGAAGVATYSGSNIRFENNTLFDVAYSIQAALWIVTNSRRVQAERVAFKNNIVVMASNRPFVFIQDLVGDISCDSNIYYSTRARNEFVREARTGNQKFDKWDFASWKQSMSSDLHSWTADPLLDKNDLYRPRAGSPAIHGGQPIEEVKTDYSGTLRPQGAPYGIGAHEH